MKLHEAIREVLNIYGKDLLGKEVLIHFLSDYCAFPQRAHRRVMKTFLQLGYGAKMLELDASQAPDKLMRARNMASTLTREGYQYVHTHQVVRSVCVALGWIEEQDAEDFTDPTSDSQSITVEGIPIRMIHIQGGHFNMGATPEQGFLASFDEKPAIDTAVESFFLGETLVTQALWEAVMGENPSHHQGSDLPVERVSWEDCQQFILKLQALTRLPFRLPTEAEWEFAARGGNHSKHHIYAGGDDGDRDSLMWWRANSEGVSHPVGRKKANELGLYDMSGNVAEWCDDWYFSTYLSARTSTQASMNPSASSRLNKVFRGGSWNDQPQACRVSKRNSLCPIYRNKLVGLRLAATHLLPNDEQAI